jgi:hypothetical protein
MNALLNAHVGGRLVAISEAEIGRPFPGTIEDQQLVLDEYGFGDYGPHAAGTRQSGQIAHGTILSRSQHP